MKKAFLVAGLCSALCILFSSVSTAQPTCSFDQKMQELVANDPQSARQLALAEEFIRNYIATHPPDSRNRTTVVFSIPVVVHVMHTGGAVGTIYNPSDAVIQSAIA